MNRINIENIIQILIDKKVKNIEAFDLKSKSNILKFIILGSCANEKTCKQIAYEIEKALKNLKYNVKIEGDYPGDWIILDIGEILIEIFTEDTRKYYNLEKLWGDYKNRVVELPNKKKKKIK